MKLKAIFFILLLLNTVPAFTQDRVTDSLLKIATKPEEDSIKVDALLALNRQYLGSNPTQALNYATQAKHIAERINYPRGLAYSYKGLGLVYRNQGKSVESIENYDHSLAIFDSLNDKKGIANILSNEGAVYSDQGDDAKSLELYLKALPVALQTTDSLRIGTIYVNIGGVYAHKDATFDKALENYSNGLKIGQSINDDGILGTANVGIGEIYFKQGEYNKSLPYFKESLKQWEGTENYPYPLNYIGKVYEKRKEFSTAIKYHQQAFEYAKKLDANLDVTQSLIGLGDTYRQQGNTTEAINYYNNAEPIALSISKFNDELRDIYFGLASTYAQQSDYANAYKYRLMLTAVKDSIFDNDYKKKLSGLSFTFDMQKKQAEVNLLTKDKEVKDLQIKRQKQARNILIGGLIIAFVFAIVLYRNYRNKLKVNELLGKLVGEIDSLLLNILPEEVARELQKTGNATPMYYENASVLFTDFKSFSKLADDMRPQDVVTELNECFIAFDDIIVKYNLEKIKTIGDSYMCAGGIPTQDHSHYINIIKAAMEIRDYMEARNNKRVAEGLPRWDIRIGINTGPLVAGVVGRKKYAYDIWGGTVNVASRMESNGEPGKVNISAATYEMVKHVYACSHRGKISAKNIGEIDMYFVDGPLLN